MKDEKDKLLDSNYDGIEEYDNSLPRWWVWLFYLTIIFGVLYSIYYHVRPGVDRAKELAQELESLRASQKQSSGSAAGELDAAGLLALASNDAAVSAGKSVFAQRCAACHGPEGQGVVGPNLTDKNWIHGGKITDIRATIENGVLEKGMLAWKGVLPQTDIDSVAAFVWTLRGTNPANPKAPQGAVVE